MSLLDKEKEMLMSKTFLKTETTYGKIILEYYRKSNHPFSLGLTDVSTNTHQQLLSHTMAINELAMFVYNKTNDLDYRFIRDPGSHMFTMGGWQINGNIITKKIEGIETIHALLTYYLNVEYAFKDLSVFHRSVIAEIVEKCIPEEILKNPKKFDTMLTNRTYCE